MNIINEVSDLGMKYYAIEEVNIEAEVEKALKGLGFTATRFQPPYQRVWWWMVPH
jgi:ATP-binding cassette subfamily F protein 3